MDIAILLFDRFTALDAVGPYETLSRLPDATVTFVAAEPGLMRTDVGSLGLMADASLDRAEPARHPRRSRRARTGPAHGRRADARLDPRRARAHDSGRRRSAPVR